MSTPYADGRCVVCERPERPATTTCRWCGWDLCAECMARHEVPTPEHLHHHASTDRCRGRKDTR